MTGQTTKKMETKHTKGEWRIRGNKIFIGDTYKSVATVHVIKNYKDTTFEPMEDIESNANARLIAAAPDMIQFVIKMEKIFKELYNYGVLTSYQHVAWNEAKQIIEKATGE